MTLSLRVSLFAALCAVAFILPYSASQASERRHGLSAFGELKYPADFKNFEYVNPDAPKGGRLATMPTSSINTFNHFNDYILRGDPAAGVGFLFELADDPRARRAGRRLWSHR